MKIKLSENAKETFARLIARFEAGEVADLVKPLLIELPEDAPARRWTRGNHIMAYLLSGGQVDCRGFNQWKAVGRQVVKPGCAYIFYPAVKKQKNKETGEEEEILLGFNTTPVFGYDLTEPIPGATNVYRTEPTEPPPLADLAAKMSVPIYWEAIAGSARGSFSPHDEKITLADRSEETFWHELGHAVHQKVAGKLKGGQDAHQETVAEFTACVLGQAYGLDLTGNAWQYIKAYNPDDPIDAIRRACGEVGRILEFLDSLNEVETIPTPNPN